MRAWVFYLSFFFQAEDGIRDVAVTGVQTCALPILYCCWHRIIDGRLAQYIEAIDWGSVYWQIGRASCRERGEISGGAVSLKKKQKENMSTGSQCVKVSCVTSCSHGNMLSIRRYNSVVMMFAEIHS